ncbi:fused MFS/spermidine synthase [Ideonella azotifigens]|uniref:PABS domain-containing protein n=1 Tax=Ideonella azotifigens TaxID=513160 RepID=A0ABN1KBE4_9BURK|nr:fused MFS/spermidine synthase [Ideonella azotifigens]MCD2338730.1 fused MFS/spermidine synthase [Ideonella azotifigens]
MAAKRVWAAHGLMLASGFAGLGYQVVWAQQGALWLGHESAAVLAVVAAFFGGLALGALLMGPRIARSPRPARWYAACEALIGGWAALLILLMPAVSGALLAITGPQPSAAWQWTVAFGGMFLLLLPATAAMGATLPAMERVGQQLLGAAQPGRALAALYASNTLGAVVGVLASAFWLLPALGLARTAACCVALNLLCAMVAWRAFAGDALPAEARAIHGDTRGPMMRFALTGLLGLGYEVLVVRVLSQVTEDTVYTFALLLAVYLVGTSLGAALLARLRKPGAVDDERLANRLLSALSVACLLGTGSLWAAEWVRDGWLAATGGGMAAALSVEALLALLAFGLPTLVMGALFSELSARAMARGLSLGRALGVNTLGAALAPLLFGVLLVPLLGPKGGLLLVAAGYLLLRSGGARWRVGSWAPAVVVLAVTVLAPPLAFVELPEGGRLVSYQEGAMAAVSVVEDARGVSRLRINNRQQEGSSATRLVDGRQALLPLLLHPAPQRALFLGMGTGVTSSVAAEDPQLQVDVAELLPEVIVASHLFVDAPRLHPVAADARRFVRAGDTRYDVIVSDNFHPARSGSGSLYTVEHFQAVRARLAAGGVFCQWLPLHQLDRATLRSIVQSFLLAYPQASAILASDSLETPVLGLVGRADDLRFDAAALRAGLARNAGPRGLAAFGLDDDFALLGSFVADTTALQRFAAHAPANTDDHPVVAYLAPRVTYAPESLPRDRLLALLAEVSVQPAQVMTADAVWLQRLSAYGQARRQFIAAGRDVRPARNAREMLAQVQAPLLAVLHTSPDFRPAYNPLLRMATALAPSDPPAARALLSELAQLQPARPEASEALKQLAL